MIHGHAYIKRAETTNHYFPCGDLREIDAIMECFDNPDETDFFYLNLKNHGFLIGYNDNFDFYKRIKDLEFEYRSLPEKL